MITGFFSIWLFREVQKLWGIHISWLVIHLGIVLPTAIAVVWLLAWYGFRRVAIPAVRARTVSKELSHSGSESYGLMILLMTIFYLAISFAALTICRVSQTLDTSSFLGIVLITFYGGSIIGAWFGAQLLPRWNLRALEPIS